MPYAAQIANAPRKLSCQFGLRIDILAVKYTKTSTNEINADSQRLLYDLANFC